MMSPHILDEPALAPVATPEALELAEIVTFLQRRLLVNLTARVTERKISIPQFTLLGFLSSNDSLNMGQLAGLMGHTTPATTGLVERLSQAGMVTRYHPEEDRRKVMVRITDKGRQIVEEMKQDMAVCITNISEQLTPADQEAWLRVYRTIRTYCQNKPSCNG
jgi:DNA-binding MarR family transcriptional regulator